MRETGWNGVADADAQVPCATATALIDGAIRVTNDPAFGLHTARAVRLEELGPALGCCCRARRSTHGLLQQATRYLRLHGRAMGLSVERETAGTLVRLEFSPPSLDRAARATSEFVLGTLASALRDASGQPGILVGAQFRHAAPSLRSEYDELFACPVKFGAPSYALELTAEPAARYGNAEPHLHPWVEQQARQVMERLPSAGPVSTQVRKYLAGRLPWGIPSMTQTAHGVSESVPSLYDRLLPEGTAFARLREELLAELARAYVRDKTLSMPEVAHLLGFEEMDVFEQSFERWAGTSTLDYRANQPQQEG